MRLPSFAAEASLGQTRITYRGVAAFGANAAGPLSMQQFAGRINPWPTFRCCGWSQLLHRFICTSRSVRPWEQCRCVRTSSGPVILCDDIVIAQADFDL
jgi:hypothetical protein